MSIWLSSSLSRWWCLSGWTDWWQLQAACFRMSVVNDRLASQRFIRAKVCVLILMQMLGSSQKVAARRDLWMFKVGCDSNYSAYSQAWSSHLKHLHSWLKGLSEEQRVVLSSFTHAMLSMSMGSLLLKTKTIKYIFITWNKIISSSLSLFLTQPLGQNNPIAGVFHILLYLIQHCLEHRHIKLKKI